MFQQSVRINFYDCNFSDAHSCIEIINNTRGGIEIAMPPLYSVIYNLYACMLVHLNAATKNRNITKKQSICVDNKNCKCKQAFSILNFKLLFVNCGIHIRIFIAFQVFLERLKKLLSVDSAIYKIHKILSIYELERNVKPSIITTGPRTLA
jgi:hypothetical protein